MTTRNTFAAALARKLAPLNEAAEDIQELSTPTLNRYSKAAREQITAISKKPGKTSNAGKAVIAKREAGVAKANDITNTRRTIAWDDHAVKSHAAFKKAADDALTAHGYEVAHPGPASTVYTKHDPETNSLFVAKHHYGNPSTSDSPHSAQGQVKLVSSNGTTSDIRHSSWGLRPREGDEPVDLHGEHFKKIVDEINDHHKWSKNSAFNQDMNEGAEYPSDEMLAEAFPELSGEPLDEIRFIKPLKEKTPKKPAYVSPARKKWVKDHENEMAPIKEGKAPYVSPVRKKWVADQIAKEMAGTLDSNHPMPPIKEAKAPYESPSRKAWVSGEKEADGPWPRLLSKRPDDAVEAEYKDQAENPDYVSPGRKKWLAGAANRIKNNISKDQSNPPPKPLVKEEVVIKEGRGRPRKDGTSAVGADREHIVMQLRKHVSLRGQNPIEFKDGSKASPGEGQARLALIIHNGLRTPQEKANYMDRLDANHESFKDAVRSKSPEEAGKAPTQKSRITLPAIDRLNAKLGPDTN
jgi:hypothetical protein